MSDESYYKLMRYEHYGMIILLVLIASDVLGAPLQMVTQAVFKFYLRLPNGALAFRAYCFIDNG